jgi:spermidine/putrescine transport system ATP-binding protein
LGYRKCGTRGVETQIKDRASTMPKGPDRNAVLLRVTGARKSFRTPEGGVVTALEGVDLAIRNNEFLTLLGPSGCGKTTLLKVIAGFEDLDAGEIELDDQPVGLVPAHRRPFNTVFQNYALFPHMTVDGNVGYGLDVAGVPRAERDQRVAAVLGLVGLVGMERRRPAQLSGGQQQRVALARALVNRPRVLLLDESLSALDRKLRQSMQIELKKLQHTVGITFLFVTHDQEEALTMSDRVAVMDSGRVLQLGTPSEIYDTPANRFVAGFIGASNIMTGTLRGQGAACAVELEGGGVLQVAEAGAQDGERVDVMVRPEHLGVAPQGASGPSLEVTLENVVFVGSDLHLYGRLPGGTAVHALHRHVRGDAASGFSPGQILRLGYAPASPHVMRRGG